MRTLLVCSTMCALLSGENGKSLIYLCSLALIKNKGKNSYFQGSCFCSESPWRFGRMRIGITEGALVSAKT